MIKPYYQDSSCTIYLGDCREILPTLPKVDLVLTDPPYGLGDKWSGGGGKTKTSWKFNPNEARAWDGDIAGGVPELITLASEVIIWGGNYYPLPSSRGWLIWDKKQNDQFTTGQAELAWTNLDQPVKVFRFAQCEQASEGPKVHPTQKPLSLMAWCLKWTTGKLILDPFMGSGTTLRAAKDHGRQSIGIELEEKYCEIAAKRLQQECLPLTMVDRAATETTPELIQVDITPLPEGAVASSGAEPAART